MTELTRHDEKVDGSPIAQSRHINTIELLTSVVSSFNISDVMARLSDIEKSIMGAAITDAKRISELAAQRHEVITCPLIEAYNRFLANQRETRIHEESLKALWALLGPEKLATLIRSDVRNEWWTETDITETANELRDRTALWEHIAQYLRFVPEAQAGEILAFFERVNITPTRQAFDGAIRLHPKVFGVRKRGRERFVFLKEGK